MDNDEQKRSRFVRAVELKQTNEGEKLVGIINLELKHYDKAVLKKTTLVSRSTSFFFFSFHGQGSVCVSVQVRVVVRNV